MAKIGIDFGTTNTTVSYISKKGEAIPIRIDGKEKIPTLLYFPKDGSEPIIGDAAYYKYEYCINANSHEEVDEILSGMISDLKQNMSQTEKIALPDGKLISYTEAISIFFKKLKDYLEKYCFEGDTITDVCITYPVTFDDTPNKKSILKDAAMLAGFNNVKLLPEPIAAAMGYSKNRNITNQGILIYDFGGGTFDIAYVKFDHNGLYMTLPSMGDANCGGVNIDYAIYEEWDNLVYANRKRHISEFEGETYLPILKLDCKKYKELMSKGGFLKYSLILPPKFEFCSLNPMSKDKWYDIISPWVDKTISLTKQMLDRVKAEKNGFTVDKVILIGGSSRLPIVSEKLKEICPVEPMPVLDVDVAVANGAAIYINIDNVDVETCYCMIDGAKMDTSQKHCMFCGHHNFYYNYYFDNQ